MREAFEEVEAFTVLLRPEPWRYLLNSGVKFLVAISSNLDANTDLKLSIWRFHDFKKSEQ